MITSFADANTEALFNNRYVKAFDQIISAGRIKLGMIDGMGASQVEVTKHYG